MCSLQAPPIAHTSPSSISLDRDPIESLSWSPGPLAHLRRLPPNSSTGHSPAASHKMGNRSSREAGAAGTANAAGGSGDAQPPPAVAAAAAGECPVPAEFRQKIYKNPSVYNVYNERINDPGVAPPTSATATGLVDPRNNMPLEPNQQPCPGQRKLLSTDRMASNIPKGGTDTTWVYPSPQMFFNGAQARVCSKGCS